MIKIYSEKELTLFNKRLYELFMNSLPSHICIDEMCPKLLDQTYSEYNWDYNSAIMKDEPLTKIYLIKEIMDFFYLIRNLVYSISYKDEKNYKLLWFKKPTIKQSLYWINEDIVELDPVIAQSDGLWLEINFRLYES